MQPLLSVIPIVEDWFLTGRNSRLIFLPLQLSLQLLIGFQNKVSVLKEINGGNGQHFGCNYHSILSDAHTCARCGLPSCVGVCLLETLQPKTR